jgi:transposase
MLYAAIDWATEHHDLTVLHPDGREALKIRISHSGEGLEALRKRLGSLGTPFSEIAVVVEMHEGPLVLWLLDQGLRVYGLNPRMAEHARDRLSPTGAKDDARDTRALAEFLRMNEARLRPLQPQDPATALMRHLVRLRENLVQDRTAQKQRLIAHLQQYAPEITVLLGDLSTPWNLALLLVYPTMKRLRKARPSVLRQFAHEHRMTGKTFRKLAEALRQTPMPVPAYLDEPHATEVSVRARTIQQFDAAIHELDQKLEDLISKHPDSNLIGSLPCQGTPTVSAIWSALEEGMKRFRSADEMAAHGGVAPVTLQSGKRKNVRHRKACDHTLRQALLTFSRITARMEDCWAWGYYRQKRAEGKGHWAALRCVARKWLRILWTVFQTQTPYDESRVRRMTYAPATA